MECTATRGAVSMGSDPFMTSGASNIRGESSMISLTRMKIDDLWRQQHSR